MQMPMLRKAIQWNRDCIPTWTKRLMRRWCDMCNAHMDKLRRLYPGFEPYEPVERDVGKNYFCKGKFAQIDVSQEEERASGGEV